MRSHYKTPIYSALVFFGTLGVLSIGYGAYSALIPVNTGDTLTKGIWNQMVGNISDLDTRINALNTNVANLASSGSLWTLNGSNISYSAGNVGIGTTDIHSADKLLINTGNNITNIGLGNANSARTSGTMFVIRHQPTDNYDKIFSYDYGSDSFRNISIPGGNVGIGTTAPEKQLHIKTAAGNAEIDLQSTTNSKWAIYHDAAGGDLRFWNVSDIFTIQKNGNVGIGTSSPTQKLEVNGKVKINDGGNGTIPGLKLYSDNVGFSSPLTSDLAFITNGATAMEILSNGNVGIGTTSPIHKLDIRGGDFVIGDGTMKAIYSYTSTNGYFGTISSHPAILVTGGTERLRIGTSGNVGIGIAAPNAKLDVNGDVKLSFRGYNFLGGSYMALGETLGSASTILGNNVKAGNGNTSIQRFSNNIDPGNYIKMTYNNGISFHTNITTAQGTDVSETTNERMRIDLSGNVYVGGTLVHSSDRRLKKDIANIKSDAGLQKILGLQGVSYKWKDTSKDKATQYGFVAQDLEKILPELVKTDDKGIKSVNYEGVIPVLVEAIKEQQKEIELLKNK